MGRLAILVVAVACMAVAEPAGAVVQLNGEARSDQDLRTGRVAATAAQRKAARRLGARHVRFNRFGTPRSLRAPRGAALSGRLRGDAVTVSRRFLRANAGLFRLQKADVGRLELVNDTKVRRGSHIVLLQQRFGDLRPTMDGLVSLAVRKGRVLYVSSTLTGADAAPPAATLSAVDAYTRFASSIGRTVGAVTGVREQKGWTVFGVKGLTELQRVRLTALPTFRQGVRPAFEVWFVDITKNHGTTAFKAYVDAVSGDVLFRRNVDLHAVGCGDGSDAPANAPDWCVFPANPPVDDTPLTPDAAADTRQVWCWTFAQGCQRTLNNEAPRNDEYGEWDRIDLTNPAANLFPPSFSTRGNNADTARAWLSPLTPAEMYRPLSPARDYRFSFVDQWHQSQCDPSIFLTNPVNGNDSDPAVTNLFVQHNRMHDFSYFLGYDEAHYNEQFSNFGRGATTAPAGSPETREGDPQIGDTQAGAVSGGTPTALGRDNANQIPFPDGVSPISNMYLWQPLDSAFYPPCVDGDYDMSVIGHEYTHATSNRMVAGPDAGLDQGSQAGAMGESWSDLVAAEYLHEFNLVPVSGENPWSVGAYVTGNKQRGIRDYPLDANPLNFSDIGFDTPGVEVHSDGEIWNAVNYDIRQAFVGRYGNGTPQVQAQCAAGRRVAQVCPGNRRWIQDVFVAFLLMQNNVDMLDARDAYLVADQLRFNGANQDLLWNAFAKRGFGVNAQTISGDDPDPLANFESPFAKNATLKFVPKAKDGTTAPKDVEVFVGDYEGDASPVADTKANDPNDPQPRSDTARFAPGTYRFAARAPGFGLVRFTKTLAAGQSTSVTVPMPRNLASRSQGATFSGPAACVPDPATSCPPDADVLANLFDDTEETSWRNDGTPVSDVRVRVDLAGSTPQPVKQVKVSAFLNPVDADSSDPTGDPVPLSRNRFTALRSFEVLTCTKTASVDCSQDGQYTKVLTSPVDAFPGAAPRPVAPDLILRSFPVPGTVKATDVVLRVLTNQCTGVEVFHTDYDNDPTADANCENSSADSITAAEFQVNAVTG